VPKQVMEDDTVLGTMLKRHKLRTNVTTSCLRYRHEYSYL